MGEEEWTEEDLVEVLVVAKSLIVVAEEEKGVDLVEEKEVILVKKVWVEEVTWAAEEVLDLEVEVVLAENLWIDLVMVQIEKINSKIGIMMSVIPLLAEDVGNSLEEEEGFLQELV